MAADASLTLVFCTTAIPGVHRWPNAPEEVAYLRDEHRHNFHVKAWAQVIHDDRQVEFITLQLQVRSAMHTSYPLAFPGVLDLGTHSCEQVARMLVGALNLYACQVSEDGENGAIIYA